MNVTKMEGCGNDFVILDFEEYRKKQQEWLKDVTKSSEFKSAPFKVVILHIPPSGSWHGGIDLRNKFLPVLNENFVDVMLSGHTHNYDYITPENYSYTDFPILVNDNDTYLFIHATKNKMLIQQKDMEGRVLNEFNYVK